MKNHFSNRVTVLISACLLVLLSACSSDDTSDSSGNIDNTIANNDFSFPTVNETNGTFVISNPEGEAPRFSARRTVEAGSGATIEFSDPVVVKYQMYSWNTGELVENTNDFDEPVTIRAGITEGVPEYLSHSLLGRKIGDKIQIIFEEGMEDLPEYLDSEDAYVLVIELI